MRKGSKILIIDDDKDLVEAMKITLEAHKYKIKASYDPEKGFQIAKKEKPDMIILDVIFGSKQKTEGFDYALKIRQDKKLADIPVLMVTSVNRQYENMEFSPDTDNEYLPVDDFVDKPIQPKELVRKVEKLLEMKTSKWVNWPHKEES